jgi:virginiamycin B lyase
MRIRDALLASTAATAAVLFQLGLAVPGHAQSAVALAGKVGSAAEPVMEGVVVSAKKDGSTITISVVTDDKGQYRFPADRLEPGHYTLGARAVGYDLEGPKAADVAAGQAASADIKLKPTRNLSAQLTNAEWMMSMPGSDEQKSFLLNCNSCHTIERIVRSTHDADEFMQVFTRMGGYYPGSTPRKPQRLIGDVLREVGRGGDKCPQDRGMARHRQPEPAGDVELSAQDPAAGHRKVDPCDHHGI